MVTRELADGASRRGSVPAELPPELQAVRLRCIHPSGCFDPFPLEATEQSLAARFEGVVRRHADRLAVATDTHRLSYDELNRAANRFAHAVLDRRGEGEEPVAVLMERTAALPAAVLGVVKAGKTFVPLDPSFPPGRLAALLADCRPRLVLTSSRCEPLARALRDDPREVLNVEALDRGASADDPDLALSPQTLAYLLYTSGSTGQPKGVLFSHRGLLHQIMRHTNTLRIGAEDRVTAFGSVGAAQANTQLFLTLLNGAALFPRDLKQDGLAGLTDWIERERITYYRSSASIFRHWARHLGDAACPTLRLVGIGGEPVYRQDFELYRRRFAPSCLLVNALSATETGTICMHVLDRESEFEGHLLPAGYPVDDTEVLVLDEAGAEVAAGEIGEIAVRSDGLAVGYWGQEELTRTRFRPDPGGGARRTYRTGDLGRRAADGSLVQLGRKDSLVKIRGNRVDVGEIETALRDHEAVRQVVVVDRDDHRGEKRLAAYVVPDGEPPPTRGTLRQFLRGRLPEYMIPFAFVFLDELPLAPSGKIDRQALPPLVPPARGPADAKADAVGILGEQLRGIWEELLGVTDVRPRDGFMDLGGDSLLAIEMLARIEQVCGRTLAPSRLLDGAITIDRLVQVLLEDEQPHFGKPVTVVQAGGARRPLFFAHGDHQNGGLYCHALARQLGPDQPFYAVTPHGLGGDALPWSLEAMASDRLAAIRAVQPAGPYRLGGFCTGGLLAFEMARQLQARGEQVETLLLIDAALPNARLPYRLLGRATRLAARGLRWSEAARRDAYLRLRRVLEAYEKSGAPGGRGRVRFLVDKLRSLPRRLVRRTERAAAEAEETSEYMARHLAYGVRRRDYVPARFAGRIALFRSSYLLDKPPGGPTAGWCHVASSVDVHPLPGNHQAAVTRHVAVLAEKMRRYLA